MTVIECLSAMSGQHGTCELNIPEIMKQTGLSMNGVMEQLQKMTKNKTISVFRQNNTNYITIMKKGIL